MKRILLGAVVILTARAALAQPAPSPQFTREFQAGVDAYRLGQYAEAREHLEKARAFEAALPGPYRFLAAVDQSEQKFEDCVAHAREAIRLNPQSVEIEATRKLHDDCRASLGRPAFPGAIGDGGAIAVTANIEGAAVTLGGLKYGATPLAPRAVAVGEVEIGVSKQGWLPQTAKVAVLPGIVTDVDIKLEPDPDAKVDTGPELGTTKPVELTTGWLVIKAPVASLAVQLDGAAVTAGADGRIEGQPGEHEIIVTAPGHEPWRRRVRIARGQKIEVEATLIDSDARARSRTIGHVAIGAGAVIAIASAGLAIYAQGQANDARDWALIERSRPSTVPIGTTDPLVPVHTRTQIQDASDRAKKFGLMSDAGFAAAAITVGVGVYFLVSERPRERAGAPAPFAIAPLIGPGDLGVVVAKGGVW
ncbi:MAG: PEGA domain-containing protein [Deltaproteobacteria bacterium]|nr:PEGA domain-containing protein [Deltaproteobacteria bacterium]